MSAVTKKELEHYRRQIKKSITVSSKEKDEMLRGLQTGIEEYLEQNPDATMEDVRAHFGEPCEIAAEFLPDVTPKDRKRFVRRKKVILGLSLGLVVIVILFIAVYFSLVWKTPGVIKETGKFEEPTGNAITVEHY